MVLLSPREDGMLADMRHHDDVGAVRPFAGQPDAASLGHASGDRDLEALAARFHDPRGAVEGLLEAELSACLQGLSLRRRPSVRLGLSLSLAGLIDSHLPEDLLER